MKKVIHISISIFLSAIILLSGSGLIIGKMVCLKSGHEIISLNEAKDCCVDESDAASVKGQCCDIKNISIHSQNFIPQNTTHLKTNFAFTINAITPSHQSFQFLLSASSTKKFVASDPPGFADHSNSLSLLGIFRI